MKYEKEKKFNKRDFLKHQNFTKSGITVIHFSSKNSKKGDKKIFYSKI